MPTTHTIIIGAGQAGLAMSRSLIDVGVEHVVLERGRVAERWHSERWDSLQLLTPNWATRLPGWTYQGHAPDRFMTAAELAAYLGDYADSFAAPIVEQSEVLALRQGDSGFVVDTPDSTWHADNVVIATGWCDQPLVPSFASRLDAGVAQLTAGTYRNPGQLPDGRVLVVGAAATGVQIADELARAGREVVLAVGRHSRAPRTYRGMDIWWWLDRIGTFARTLDDVSDPVRARSEGAIQLVGRDDRRDVDLPALQSVGVRLAGRLAGVDDHDLVFGDGLDASVAAADERLTRLLAQIDEHITASGLDAEVLPATRPAAVRPGAPIGRLHASRDRIDAVVWATGYRRTYPWLDVPVLDRAGEITQRRGITPIEGLYVLGQRFQHRRDANFIDGVRFDAAHVAHHLGARLHGRNPTPHVTTKDAS